MLKVVLDTNVIVSGLIASSGCPYEILQAHRRGEYVLVVSEAIVEEVERVLARPFFHQKRRVDASDIAAAGRLLRTDAVVVAPRGRLAVIADDPDDDRILECALEGGADYVISGDHHLLSLRQYRNTPIVTAREFLAMLEAQEQ